jgi:hypothetical protein
MGRKEVAVDFITRLKDKGFKDLDKATKKSQALLTKFGKGLGLTFGAVAIGAFVKKSVNQFATLEKSTKRLESELTNLGLAFASSLASDFTRALSLSSGVSQNELNPALQKLIQTTYTLTDAQKLLSLSTEISRQKGLELTDVSNALSRAFVGDYKALVKLRIGYETAELKGKDFADVLKELEADFSSKQVDTFADKINKLKIAFEQTQVAVGKGFVEGLEASGLSIEETQEKMIALGEAFGTALGKAVGLIDRVSSKFNELANSRPVLALFDLLDRLAGIDYGDAGRAADAKLKADLAAGALQRKALQDQAKLTELLKLEADLAKKRAAEVARLKREELKRAQEKKRSADLDKLRNSIQFKFDIDAINLQAALRRQLSQTDRDRALQLSALKISDYQTDEEAIKTLKAATEGRYNDAMNLEKVLQLLKTAGFANDKTAIEALAALKPDIKFTDNLDDILAKLKAIIEGKYTINIGATISVPNVPGAGGTATASPGGGNFQPGTVISPGTGAPGTGTGGSLGAFPTIPGTGSSAIIDTITEIIANQNTLTANFLAGLPSGLDANALATARYELQARTITAENQLTNYLSGARYQGMANDITAQNTMTNQLAADRYTAMQNYYTGAGSQGVTVNVNIEGSLLSQNDLVAAVTDAVYQTQRTGNDLIVSAI